MKKISTLLITLLVSVVFQQTTFAQATRTWVSGVGDDANPCSRTAPCKTFAGAISKTAAGGEISALDPAGYGAISITKSITINGEGTLASILSVGVNGIIINGAGIHVTIKDVFINGAGTGTNGIRILNAAQVHIEDCSISGIVAASGASGNGIVVENSASKSILTVKNTTITGPHAMNGISVKCTAAAATDSAVAFIDNVHIQGVGTAIIAKEKSRVNVVNSYISNNTIAIAPEQSTSITRLSNNIIISNNTGIAAGVGYNGKVVSFGNNQIVGNAVSAPPTTVSSSQ
ncbi:right-handed parallel beta-helix repeat-containing protein [Emticicia agri]|uniref:Right handed beta helix domain-containing protein n=1 Tax=Emticicia agri TaxID=2492393 RepID=A0A4Q5M3U5_9BACT|nr:right-handed parallel beta-helix repeat-containing protein [Emticicia agri]RYU96583.1 hypothetical protein EWM59_05380 [Emticicia agri]